MIRGFSTFCIINGIIQIDDVNRLNSFFWKVMKMLTQWLIELAKGVGMLFLNPLFYWIILLLFVVGYRRIQKERMYFGIKVFDLFSEGKNTWLMSILIGLIISLATVGIGFVFSIEMILLLSIVMIILSLTFKLSLLSASYTIGITYIVLFLSPLLLEYQTYVDVNLFSKTNFTGLVILLGVFLVVEAIMIGRTKREETYPALTLGNRGYWIGEHQLRKLTVIPFFVLVPTGLITPFASFWPYFSMGGESFSLILVPFLIGFDYTVRGSLPQEAAKKLSKSFYILGVIILALAIGSIYIPWLSMTAVFLAIIGREFINYKHRTHDREQIAYFSQVATGLKVLAVIPETPGHRLGILPGETIVKVNGAQINHAQEFYVALQESGAYFKIDILDDANEVRFVQGALYEGDHHKLGLIFTRSPYRSQTV